MRDGLLSLHAIDRLLDIKANKDVRGSVKRTDRVMPGARSHSR